MIQTETLAGHLREVLGEDGLLVGDTSGYAVDGQVPAIVAFPRTVEQVARVVAVAAAEGAAIIPVGGRNWLGAGGIPRRLDAVLSLAWLDRVVEYDVANLTVTVEAGVTLAALDAILAPNRHLLPLDPPLGGRSTVGGVLSANLSGPRRLLYGSARDLVLGLRVVTAEGKVIHTGGKVMKNVTGYDMNKLFIGSLGSLGVIVEATFRLWPRPEAEKMVTAAFTGLAPAASTVARILGSELVPSALEVLSPAAAADASTVSGVGGSDRAFWLLVGAEGFVEAVDRQAEQVSRLCAEAGAVEVRTFQDAGLAQVRSALEDLPRLAAMGGELVVAKVAVPLSQVESACRALERAAEAEGTRLGWQAAGGVGIIRAYLTAPPGAESSSRLSRVVAEGRTAAASIGGSLVLEAAPVAVKERVDAWGPSGNEIGLMRSLKQQMDPAGTLNPGRFVGGL